MNKEKITWVDSLKGIAMMGVIMIHSGGGGMPSLLGKIGNIGKNGVQLFFLLSAYLTYVSLEHFSENHNFTFNNMRIWWAKRFVKLIPIYYLSMLACGIWGGGSTYWLGLEKGITVRNVLSHLLFLHGLFPHYANSIIGVEWYLGVLAIFYILAPFIYKIINTLEKSITAFVISTFACSVLCRYIFYIFPQTEDSYIYRSYTDTLWIFAQLPVLILGIVLYYIIKSDICSKCLSKSLVSYSLLIFVIFMMGGQALEVNELFGIKNLTLFGIWFLMVAISQQLHRCPLIDNKFFRLLGKYSYPIYLFHFLFIQIYEKTVIYSIGNNLLDWLVEYTIVIVISLIVAVLLTKFFEEPVIRVLSKLRKNKIQ